MTVPSASARVTSWPSMQPVSAASLQMLMMEEGLAPYSWSNAPFDASPPHSHGYDKVIYVVRGSIEFTLGETDDRLNLKAGDRLDLPAGIVHAALVGPEGVMCLEAHR